MIHEQAVMGDAQTRMRV